MKEIKGFYSTKNNIAKMFTRYQYKYVSKFGKVKYLLGSKAEKLRVFKPLTKMGRD